MKQFNGQHYPKVAILTYEEVKNGEIQVKPFPTNTLLTRRKATKLPWNCPEMMRRRKTPPRHKRPPSAPARTAAASADENRAEKTGGGKITFPPDIRRPNPARPPPRRGARAGRQAERPAEPADEPAKPENADERAEIRPPYARRTRYPILMRNADAANAD